MDGPTIFILVVLGVLLVSAFATFKTVPQGEVWTLERFGQFVSELRPGLHIIVPIVYAVGHKVNVQEQVLDVPPQDVITRDNVTVTADGVVFYQVVNAAKAAYEVRDMQRAITALALTNLRTVIGEMDLDEVLSQRDSINTKVLRVVDQATNPWGVKVTRIEVKDLRPPHDVTDSMTRQMKAERERRAEVTEAEGEKAAAILRAEGRKQAAVLEAEGRREAAFRDAEAREREAEAEAKATAMVSEAIARGDVNAINYFVAQKYVGAFETLASAPNQKVIMLPMETSGLLSSLGGITELVKDAMKKQEG